MSKETVKLTASSADWSPNRGCIWQ